MSVRFGETLADISRDAFDPSHPLPLDIRQHYAHQLLAEQLEEGIQQQITFQDSKASELSESQVWNLGELQAPRPVPAVYQVCLLGVLSPGHHWWKLNTFKL